MRKYKSLNLNPISRDENESLSQKQSQDSRIGSYDPHSRSLPQDESPGYQHQSQQSRSHSNRRRSRQQPPRSRSPSYPRYSSRSPLISTFISSPFF